MRAHNGRVTRRQSQETNTIYCPPMLAKSTRCGPCRNLRRKRSGVRIPTGPPNFSAGYRAPTPRSVGSLAAVGRQVPPCPVIGWDLSLRFSRNRWGRYHPCKPDGQFEPLAPAVDQGKGSSVELVLQDEYAEEAMPFSVRSRRSSTP